ncbi:hypothetical protein BJX64DRAFT_98235 [Aspergillus heterothallicus]
MKQSSPSKRSKRRSRRNGVSLATASRKSTTAVHRMIAPDSSLPFKTCTRAFQVSGLWKWGGHRLSPQERGNHEARRSEEYTSLLVLCYYSYCLTDRSRHPRGFLLSACILDRNSASTLYGRMSDLYYTGRLAIFEIQGDRWNHKLPTYSTLDNPRKSRFKILNPWNPRTQHVQK